MRLFGPGRKKRKGINEAMTNTIESTPIDVNEILDALEAFIKRRPRLEYGNYGSMAPYRAEIRSIAKDKKRAMEALAAVRQSTSHDARLLADSFRAFSGRRRAGPGAENRPSTPGQKEQQHTI